MSDNKMEQKNLTMQEVRENKIATQGRFNKMKVKKHKK